MTRPRLIFGVDPGADHEKGVQSVRGTGWCLVAVPVDGPARLEAFGQVVGGPDAWLAALKTSAVRADGSTEPARAALSHATEIVCEGFKLINRAAKPDPLEIIGMMKMYAQDHRLPITISRPGSRTAVTHDDLKRISWWPGGAGHADTAQAIRHVLSMLLREGHRPTQMWISPPDQPWEPLSENSSMLRVTAEMLEMDRDTPRVLPHPSKVGDLW